MADCFDVGLDLCCCGVEIQTNYFDFVSIAASAMGSAQIWFGLNDD